MLQVRVCVWWGSKRAAWCPVLNGGIRWEEHVLENRLAFICGRVCDAFLVDSPAPYPSGLPLLIALGLPIHQEGEVLLGHASVLAQ